MYTVFYARYRRIYAFTAVLHRFYLFCTAFSSFFCTVFLLFAPLSSFAPSSLLYVKA